MPALTPDPRNAHDFGLWFSDGCVRWPSEGREGGSSEAAPEPGNCVLVGPEGGGKSRFLTSLSAAFEGETSGDWVRFVPGRKLAAELIKGSTGREGVEESQNASQLWETFDFQLGLRVGTSLEECEVSVLVTPGALFSLLTGENASGLDTGQVDGLKRAALNAQSLVICVDVRQQRGKGRIRLPGLIDGLLIEGPLRLRRMGAKPWPARESPWQRSPRRQLPFERVLVVLTGIESLCTETAERLNRATSNWQSVHSGEIVALSSIGDLSPLRIAEILDPWALAAEQIDGLDLLRTSLRPDAMLAVCGVSLAGLECALGELEGPRSDLGDAEPIPLERLRFFGVWPSLLFMATGRIAHPVIGAESLTAVQEARWLRLRIGS